MVVAILLGVDLTIMTTWQVADPFYRAIKQMEPYVSTKKKKKKKKKSEKKQRSSEKKCTLNDVHAGNAYLCSITFVQTCEINSAPPPSPPRPHRPRTLAGELPPPHR